MVFYKEDKDSKIAILTCGCGCQSEFHITKYSYDVGDSAEEIKDYTISSHSANWYTEQDGIFKIIGKRLKRAWSALRGKDYLYQDVCLSEKDIDELIETLKGMK